MSNIKSILAEVTAPKKAVNLTLNSKKTEIYTTAPVSTPRRPKKHVFDINKFKVVDTKSTPKKSYYTVKFDVDLCDADYTSATSDVFEGEMDEEELIKLTILANFKDLSAYDGGWYSMGPLQEFMAEYVGYGLFHDVYNRFTVEDVIINGYDAEKGQYYTIPIPDQEDLGIDDIDEAYEKYFALCDEED